MATSTKMSIAERESFLADVRIGVLSIDDPGRGPLTAPVWYGYKAGEALWFLTEPQSLKGKALANVQRISLCVQTEEPPYKYVSVEGPIIGRETPDPETHLRFVAQRYLGEEMGDTYVAANAKNEPSILIRMQPERWLTVDYGKSMPI